MRPRRGSTALVTGASRGLGAAFAAELARQGVDLVLTARSGEALRSLAGALTAAHGVRCTPVVADLADPEAARTLMEAVDAQGIAIDLLINNAGLGHPGRFLSHDLTREGAAVQVNVQSLLALTHLCGNRMVARGGGGIINIASNAALQPVPWMAVYAAGKAFVLHFSEALRVELEGSGVRVMAACPGATATGFFDDTAVAPAAASLDSAEDVAARTLRDFAAGKAVSHPGRASQQLAMLAPRILPRSVTVRIAATVGRKMGLDTA